MSGSPLVKDSGMRSIGTHCKDVRRLQLVDMKQLTGEALLHIARECRLLNSLNITSSGSSLKDEQAVQCVVHLTNLASLNVSHCKLLGDTTMMAVAKYCEYLRELQINGCERVTIRGVSAVMGGSLKLIKKLGFSGVRIGTAWAANNTLKST